ncbi:MAG: fructose-bisphosphate aldolase [Verrucomicrobia bacterium]|nr:fructose-bisphosphate aldolase [Verrucomicrobiota bacterium]
MDSTVRALLTAGKGILAADESFPTIGKRFAKLGVASTEENRRAYRDMLFTTPGLEEFISGVILFDETLRQKTSGGVAFPEHLAGRGIVPGIKVDLGAADLPGFPGEKFTQGLDGLRERLAEYRKLGARFTKWRAVIAIGEGLPTPAALETNAGSLALFAALCQEAQLVPIVEPEVLMDGDHSLERCEEVTAATLRVVFAALARQGVQLKSMLLKTGMVLPGKEHRRQGSTAEIAAATVRCLRRAVPAAVPGVVFLSGGQSPSEATERLEAICAAGTNPWALSFSFGRALQDPAMAAWKGARENVGAGQTALRETAAANHRAILAAK